ncbi:uncharacterized protein LOC127788167 [Diospyros lotus]|uniref:uncharacterized protein LOC127788167 n=1 Tax=Diospyros lotus TaxID=55363 RepID=UPI00225C1D11|nr:uncharacterized protein LOC127788167 [Diospyros lotus]
MAKGTDVGDHILKMTNLIGQLEVLEFYMDVELLVDLILQSLPQSFAPFILNFNMNKLECWLPELLNMLTIAQAQIKGKKQEGVLAITSSSKTSKRKKSSSKKKKKLGLKRDISKNKHIENKAKGKCFHCQKDGYWKRNYPVYLSSLKVKHLENQRSSISSFYVTEMIKCNFSYL